MFECSSEFERASALVKTGPKLLRTGRASGGSDASFSRGQVKVRGDIKLDELSGQPTTTATRSPAR